MKNKLRNDFDLADAISKINQSLGTVTNTLTQLQPLASTMSTALKAAGYTPPSDLNALAAAFQAKIVAPVTGITTGDVQQNIINFVRDQMAAKANGASLSAAQLAVANGGNNVLNRLNNSTTFTDIFTNPYVIIGFVVIVGVVIWLISSKK